MRGKPGRVVQTQSGKNGIVYNHEAPINGKIRVHLLNDEKLLCAPETLKVIGFIN